MASSLGPDDLVLTSSTLGNPPFPRLVEAAAAAGCAGLSLWPAHDFAPARAAGYSVGDLRSMLADSGLVVNDVDAIVAWTGPDDPGPPYFEEPDRRVLFETADALGAALVNVLLIGVPDASLDDVAATFAAICDEAAEHGLGATIEFSLRTLVPDLTSAARVVGLAGRPGGAVLLDSWHFSYGPSTLEDLLALPGSAIGGVQLNDGPSTKPRDYGHATRYRRLPPGAGDFDLAGIVGALRRIGYGGPLTIEVFNEPMLVEQGMSLFASRVTDGLRAIMAGSGC